MRKITYILLLVFTYNSVFSQAVEITPTSSTTDLITSGTVQGSLRASATDILLGTASLNTTGFLRLRTQSSSRIVIHPNYNVGVGSLSTAEATLHVFGNSVLASNTVNNPDDYSNNVIAGSIQDGGGWSATGIGGKGVATGRTWGIGYSGTSLYFGVGNGSSNSTLSTSLQLKSDGDINIAPTTGYLGVGQSLPSYKIDVLHSGSSGARIKSSSTYSVVDIDAFSGDAALRFAKNGNNNWNVRNNPATDALQFYELDGGGERLRIDKVTGKVVISENAQVVGSLSKGGGSFKIDHPLDPENKFLYHSFVESPDMMNIYNGNITTDASGKAKVTLPDYFEALNMEFRYQLTIIGQTFAQAIVTKEIVNNEFEIATNQPNIKVSWQVTGIRHDAFAEKNRIPTVELKKGNEVGKYLHPTAFGKPKSMQIGAAEAGMKGDKSSIDSELIIRSKTLNSDPITPNEKGKLPERPAKED